MVNTTCYVQYCEVSQFLMLNVEPGCTVLRLKARALERMKQQMQLTFPDLELDPKSVDIYPDLSDDKTFRQLQGETATIVVWPKSSGAGNSKPVLESVVAYRKIAEDAIARGNAAKLVNETQPKLTTSGRLSSFPQPPLKFRLQALEQENLELKQENRELKQDNLELKQESRELKTEIHELKQKIRKLEEENGELKRGNVEVKGISN